MGMRTRWIAGAALALLLTGCSQSSTGPLETTPPPPSPSPSTFDPSLTTTLYSPVAVPARPTVPLIVLVPGGGWQSHDSTGFMPLATGLSDAGYLVATTEYRAGNEGIGFPASLQDVLCSTAYAAALASRSEPKPGPVVLVGHSAGGHLAALAAVSGTTLARPCADPIPEIAGVVGLAGIYDTQTFQPMMADWFGTPRADDVALWESGDPIHYVQTGAAPSTVQVLLIHGDGDDVVPLSQSRSFASALEDAGIPVELDVLAGEDHMSVIAVGVVQEPIETWLDTWATP
ncbi:alpha/beta hydrolase family protein [Longivirga aurantiaca]|uniref:Alpha/beta hydrolase family protein n=1 Tax=Longivirga aurantiaca TaxID=1837743 RepID=A0ABW1T186_9ACTN